jgi:hypothetical protein
MIVFYAPADNPNVGLVLPNPELSDEIRSNADAQITRAMDGTTYTYVKRKGTITVNYTFTLTRMKAYEFRDFYLAYASERMKIVNHDDDVIIGYITNNPLSKTFARRGVYCNDKETVVIDLEFKGEVQ